MAKLTDHQKLFVVQRLACFYTPTEVRAQLQQAHGVEVPLNQLSIYDPDTAEGERLSTALKELFRKTRQDFIERTEAIPIAHRSYRLRKLQDLVNRAGDKSPKMVAAWLEQAAKEVGGMFTNRRELTGAAGGPVQVQQVPYDFSHLSDAELDQLERILDKATAADGSEGGEAPPAR